MQYPLMIEKHYILGIEGMYLKIIKAIYDKFTVSIVLSAKKLKSFPLGLGTRQGCPF